MEVNDIKAMREVLEAARSFVVNLEIEPFSHLDEVASELLARIDVALSAPPRNCDRFNTGYPMKDAEDAYGAWQRHCDNPTIPPSCKVESAFRQWLFATATERKGEADGSK